MSALQKKYLEGEFMISLLRGRLVALLVQEFADAEHGHTEGAPVQLG